MSTTPSRRSVPVAVAVAAAILLSACGSSGSSPSATRASAGAGHAKLTTLNVGIVGIAPDASMYLGIRKGFFAAQGLKIVPHISGGGSAVIPGVVSGSLQIGSSNPVSLILAANKGLPLQMISGQNEAAASAQDTRHIISGVLVRRNGPIHSVRDLAGATIGVNALDNIGDVTITAALRKLGVPTQRIKFVEVGFPDMLTALDSGRMQAVWELDPFLSQGRRQGDRMILANFEAAAPRLPLTEYFVTKSYAAAHEDVIARFRTAMTRSSTYASAHPRQVRQIVTSFAKIPAAAANAMALPVFTTGISMAGLQTLTRAMESSGLIKSPPNLDQLVATR